MGIFFFFLGGEVLGPGLWGGGGSVSVGIFVGRGNWVGVWVEGRSLGWGCFRGVKFKLPQTDSSKSTKHVIIILSVPSTDVIFFNKMLGFFIKKKKYGSLYIVSYVRLYLRTPKKPCQKSRQK